MFSDIPGLSPLDASGTSYLSCDSQKDPWMLPDAKRLLGEQNLCWLRNTGLCVCLFFYFLFYVLTEYIFAKNNKKKKERKKNAVFFLKIGSSLIRKLRSQYDHRSQICDWDHSMIEITDHNGTMRMDSVCAVSQSVFENWLHVVEL